MMTVPSSPAELRAWLEERLKREVPDSVWDELDRDRYVASALESTEGLKLLVEKARRLIRRHRRMDDKHFSGTLQKIVKEVIPENEHIRAAVMSDHWARHANEDSDVRRFRGYLGGTVTRHQAQQFLEANAGNKEVMEDLKATCHRVSSFFRWSTQQTLLFLLTGKPPMVEPIEVSRWSTKNSVWGNAARVTLSFDVWVSNATILRVVDRLRRMSGLLGKRPIEPKTLELAALVSETMFDKNQRSQRALMEQWNDDFPEWKYSDERHFARDCRRAKRIILFMNAGAPELGPGEEYPGAF